MRKILTTTLMIGSMTAAALTPAPNEKTVDKVFINANIHVGNGQVLKDAQFAIQDGKIIRAGYYKAPYNGNEIDLQGANIYPGFILTNTNLGLTEVDAVKATVDTKETGQLNPNIRSLTSYNTDSERIPTMRFNGILLAQTTPGGGLVSGSSSVVQLDAWNWEDAAVKKDDGLHINWPAEWSKQFDFSTFTMKLKQDKNYLNKVTQIKALFEDTQSADTNSNLKLQAIQPVFEGNKKIYIHTNSPKSIIESINYFKSIGIEDLVLVSGQASTKVIEFIKNSNVSVIITAVHSLPGRKDSPVDSVYELPAKLVKAGVLTALSYPGSMSSRNLPFTAGNTVSYGLTSEQALSLITENAAKILGIDKQYGTLEVGKSATFFISDGDALDMRGNLIKEAYIDGRKIQLHTRQQELYDRYQQKYAE
jgi:imidazolonepropionase-like amidohydrolase